MTAAAGLDTLLRELAPRVLGVLVRRHGEFATCEDAVQEALLAAAVQWPVSGVPDNPAGWLITAASRRRIELWRTDSARVRRERTVALLEPAGAAPGPAEDDTLILMLLCCHPSLSVPSQVALTLRAVGGLSTAEIARGFLVPEATIGQRISRAKQKLHGAAFELPGPAELPGRVIAVNRVLYLIFNEGYTASSGSALHRADLTAEAIRLTRELHARRPDDGETAGLLAPRKQTGRRSWCSTTTWPRWHQAPWSRSTASSPSRWCTGRRSRCGSFPGRWRRLRRWLGITGCTRCGRTCWR